MLTDPIADFLTRIRNAQRAGHDNVSMPTSKMKASICEVLKKNAFIFDYSVEGRVLNIVFNRQKIDLNLKRVSKPGQRIYVGFKDIPRVLSGLGICILSTPQGILSSRDAKKQKVGGEMLCKVY